MFHKVSAALLFCCFIPWVTPAFADINRDEFFSNCRVKMPAAFTGEKSEAFAKIFDYWEGKGYKDRRALAYVLATAYRETAGTMKPVREGLCLTDACSIKKVTAHFAKGNVTDNYAHPDASGNSYFGRGFVQITHAKNYRRVGQALGWGDKLWMEPSIALQTDKAIVILVEGMTQGLFTGKKLSDSFNESKEDWHGARGIVNPNSKRAHITAEHAKVFHACFGKI